MIHYREFRFRKLNTPEFKHLKYLIFWPVFVLVFKFLETDLWKREYHPVYSALDDLIPFYEIYIIPYALWHVFVPGMLLWLLFQDADGFTRMMRFIILTYGVTILIYFLFPTCQNLRPQSFENDNLLTKCVAYLYRIDSNTNVWPSIHVIGTLAAVFAAFYTPSIRSMNLKIAMALFGVLICASTVHLKQHSILDVFTGLLLSAAAWPLVFRRAAKKESIPAAENASTD